MSDRLMNEVVLPGPGLLRRIAAVLARVNQRAVPVERKSQLPGGRLDHAGQSRRGGGGGRGGPGRVRGWLRAAWRRHRSRQQITRLGPHLLRDIGLTHAEAEAEANKPFWRQ